MKLRNKKTGEIVETDFELSVSVPDDEKLYGNNTYTQINGYSSIKDLIEDWEDYEEPKEYWFIDVGTYEVDWCEENEDMEADKEIGNYFETKEEAEKAVEKLKALKRLKDKGLSFRGWFWSESYGTFTGFSYVDDGDDQNRKDLDLLFGGEE